MYIKDNSLEELVVGPARGRPRLCRAAIPCLIIRGPTELVEPTLLLQPTDVRVVQITPSAIGHTCVVVDDPGQIQLRAHPVFGQERNVSISMCTSSKGGSSVHHRIAFTDVRDEVAALHTRVVEPHALGPIHSATVVVRLKPTGLVRINLDSLRYVLIGAVALAVVPIVRCTSRRIGRVVQRLRQGGHARLVEAFQVSERVVLFGNLALDGRIICSYPHDKVTYFQYGRIELHVSILLRMKYPFFL